MSSVCVRISCEVPLRGVLKRTCHEEVLEENVLLKTRQHTGARLSASRNVHSHCMRARVGTSTSGAEARFERCFRRAAAALLRILRRSLRMASVTPFWNP